MQLGVYRLLVHIWNKKSTFVSVRHVSGLLNGASMWGGGQVIRGVPHQILHKLIISVKKTILNRKILH
jgi:hypothetical protein